MTEMEVSSSLEGRKYTHPTRCSAEGALGVVGVKFAWKGSNLDEYEDILDAKGAELLLGNDLYRACKGIGVQQQGIGELTDKRAAAKGSDMSSILTMMMRLAILVDKADVIAFCLGRGADLDILHMEAVADYEAFASHRVMIEAKAVGIDHRVRWTGNFLCVAVGCKNLKWAEFCLEKGADPNSKVDRIKPVIALAAEQGFQAMVELLLAFDAKLRGSGAIVLAAAAGKTEMVRLRWRSSLM